MTLKFSDENVLVNGYTLVLPSVSVGNIGQLTVDIILSNTRSKKISDFYHDALIPVVSSGTGPNGITTAGEVFSIDDGKYVFFQIRSAVTKFKEEDFVSSLLKWAASSGIANIIMLSSISATERIDSQLKGTQVRHLSNKCENLLDKLKWTQLEKRTSFPSLAPGQSPDLYEDIFLPGSGFSKTFFRKGLEENFKFIILFLFASEGDNRQDSRELAHHFNDFANLFEVPAKFPQLWTDSFEDHAPELIY